MKEYYIIFERQGNTEIAVKVEAENEDDAYDIAFRTLLNQCYDTYCETERPDVDCMIIDENGEEC